MEINMKKGDIVRVDIDSFTLPSSGSGVAEDGTRIKIKNALPGQTVMARITKKRGQRLEGRIEEIIKNAPDHIAPVCSADNQCGGCTFQTIPYQHELDYKEAYILKLLRGAWSGDLGYEGIIGSPGQHGYRNKMEYSFGDDHPGGPLKLGMHETGSFYNIINTDNCLLTDADFDRIRSRILHYFQDTGADYFHKRTHKGLLRHLVVRKGAKTGEILINLVTSSDGSFDREAFVNALLALELDGTINGIIHTTNDREADAVIPEKTETLYGTPLIHDSILGLHFEISPFSFFQVNTEGAEELYSVVRDFAGDGRHQTIYDLYCGTGTITQLLSERAEKVIGIELVEEAVDAARRNSQANGISHCEFIAGDVLKEAGELKGDADLIILDPPRSGIHPKAIFKILDLDPDEYIYVSCNPESLARDIPFFTMRGYEIRRTKIVDMFPRTGHVETVVLLTKKDK
jgi:23S rRNA (uracil1939-C5)-methyltransferase